MRELDTLKETSFYRHFAALSEIPRCSGAETAAGAHVLRTAQRAGLEASMDAAGNVLVRKPASPGREDRAPIALQAHLDMVCEKRAGCAHDFARDPIVPVVRDGFLCAQGTTLGADNGVGVAYILAVLEDRALEHPPIEALFTVAEETGMDGMMQFDADSLLSRRMLNLDSEEEGFLFAGCAGGGRFRLELPLKRAPLSEAHCAFRLSVGGLRGGHSGMDIHRERGNALLLLGRALSSLRAALPVELAALTGGGQYNAIPREAEALLLLPAADAPALEALCTQFAATLQKEFEASDPDLSIVLERAQAAGPVLTDESLERLLDALLLIPNGVLGQNPLLPPGTPDLSSNLGVAELGEDSVLLCGLYRGHAESKLALCAERLRRLATLLGASLTLDQGYPAWEYRKDSPLRETAAAVWRAETGREPAVLTLHAGLECALMAERRPEMDLVSIGPDLFDVHTPDERADIASMLRVFQYLIRLLAALD